MYSAKETDGFIFVGTIVWRYRIVLFWTVYLFERQSTERLDQASIPAAWRVLQPCICSDPGNLSLLAKCFHRDMVYTCRNNPRWRSSWDISGTAPLSPSLSHSGQLVMDFVNSTQVWKGMKKYEHLLSSRLRVRPGMQLQSFWGANMSGETWSNEWWTS